jgi:hypothetical protein
VRRPTSAAFTAVIALAICLTGCGGHTAPAGVGVAAVGEHFTDLHGKDIGVIDLAARTVRDRCVDDAGFARNLVDLPKEAPDLLEPVIASARGAEPETEAQARERGLGWDVPAQPARVVSFDPRYDAVLARCTSAAWNRIGARAATTFNSYLDVVNQVTKDFGVRVDARSDPTIPAKMYDCMAAHGYPATDRQAFLSRPDPTVAFAVPLGSTGGPDTWQPARTPGTVQIGPPVPARHYVPTPAESALAVAWWRCGIDTGRQADYRRASDLAQRALIHENAARLSALIPAIETLARNARKLLSSGGTPGQHRR